MTANTIATCKDRARRMLSPLRIFRHNRRGMAAVEFALILPVALALYTGAIVYGDAIAIDRKVTLTTHAVTDLVTQTMVDKVTMADIANYLGASSAVISPYSAANLSITVSEVQVDPTGTFATVVWSRTLNGTARTPGTRVTIPASILVANAVYVLGESSYSYTPAIGYMVTGSITLTDQTYMSPRNVSSITCTDCPTS